jgi:hypothetical protein
MKKVVDENLLNKIQKLFMLGKSPNMNEAAAAIKKAEALMEEYDLSFGEVHFIEEREKRNGKKCYLWESKIFWAVCYANNCIGSRDPGNGQFWVTGRKINVFLSLEMFNYLTETVKRIAKEECKNKGHKFNHDFKLAAAETLKTKINEYAEKVSWAVDRKEERNAIEKFNKSYVNSKEKYFSFVITEAMLAGSMAGDSISLHKQTGIEETKLLGA